VLCWFRARRGAVVFRAFELYAAVPIFIRKTECNHEIATCHILLSFEKPGEKIRHR
jgi:hypothetical protein